jgi:uncharacterized paraquat-inducible protein A
MSFKLKIDGSCRRCNTTKRPHKAKGYCENCYRWSLRNQETETLSVRDPKQKARMDVRVAIRNGSITKDPCVICKEKKVQAHHQDYSKPLEIVWLCAKCHTKAHKKDIHT